MDSRCRFCRSTRQIRIPRSSLGMLFGGSIPRTRHGNIPPGQLGRLRNGVSGMIQVVMAGAVISDDHSPRIWLCRACGYWESES